VKKTSRKTVPGSGRYNRTAIDLKRTPTRGAVMVRGEGIVPAAGRELLLSVAENHAAEHKTTSSDLRRLRSRK